MENQPEGNMAVRYGKHESDVSERTLPFTELAHIMANLFWQQSEETLDQKNERVAWMIGYMQSNYSKKITLEELALEAHYSPFHFIRLFKKETGKTPFQYLTKVRLEKAKEFLTATDKPVTEICFQCGFQNSSHFANFFKLHTGISPSKFRRRLAEEKVMR